MNDVQVFDICLNNLIQAETAANIQDELAKEKTDRSKEKESFQSQIAELVKEGDEKDKSIKELNDNIASKDGEIIAFRKQVDEVSSLVVMQ